MRLPPVSTGAEPRISAVDLVDSFYLFDWSRLAEWFAFHMVFKASDFDLLFYIDSDGVRHDLDPTDDIFACLSTLPMGGTFSLHWCHCVMLGAMVRAAVDAFGLTLAAAIVGTFCLSCCGGQVACSLFCNCMQA